MNKITVNIEVTPKMLDLLTDKILVKGGKKLLDKISEKALQKSKSETELIYTVNEVAEIVKLSRQTVIRHIEHEMLIATRLGKDYRITQTNLNNYINGTYNE